MFMKLTNRVRQRPRSCALNRSARLLLPREMHGAEDIGVTRAAAKIAGKIFADLIVGRVWNFVQQRFNREDESGGAIGALQSTLAHEGFLNGVK